jgi:small redox-active disulfide protein 2
VGAARDVTHVRIGAGTVGLAGLQLALEAAAHDRLPANDVTARRLLERLRRDNYVPVAAEAQYLEAVLLEYRRHLGEAVAAAPRAELEVKILGPGCPRCETLERQVREALEQASLAADVEHVSDPEAIARFGLVATPGLVVNGEMKSMGRLPTRQELLDWLRDGASAWLLPGIPYPPRRK